MPWFDPSQYDPAQTVPQWPLGKWPVVAVDSDKQAVKDKPNSGMLVFSLKIIDGPHKDFVGSYRLNLWNESAQAKEIAHKQLSALCYVTQTWSLDNQQKLGVELFNKPFLIIVTPQDDPKYTTISQIMDIAGNLPVRQQPSAQAAPQQMPPQAAPQASWQQPAAPPVQTAPQAPWGAGPGSMPPNPAPMQPSQPQAGPAPPWGAPPANPAPAQQPAAGQQPSWAQQPPNPQPSWSRQ